MKKIIWIILSSVIFWSCKKDLTELNNDPKSPTVVPSYTLLTSGQKAFADLVTTPSVNTNIFRLIVQHWTETTYTDESNYDITTRNIPVQIWNGFYRDVLKSLQEAKTLIPNDVLTGTGEPDVSRQANEIAIVDIMQVYSYYYLVTTFGNIPYSQSLDINTPLPSYDDASTVYNDLLQRLDADLTALDESAGTFGSADLFYNGDVASWKKFGNSLKVKMGILIADSDPALSKTTVESAAPNAFTSNADNALMPYLSAPPNTNPAYTDQIQSGRGDFVVTDLFVNTLTGLKDPRIPAYFTVDGNGGYSGGIYGSGNNFAALSKPSGYDGGPGVFQINFPGTILSYSEVEFYLAEAAARGYNVGGTVESHYNAAITASIEEWGGTTAQAAAYLAQPTVAYATAAGDWKQKIGMQAWIGLYNRGFEAWTEWRRLDVPSLEAPEGANSGIPVRFTYSVTEQNLNTKNYETASSAIGGDAVETKLWFDKN